MVLLILLGLIKTSANPHPVPRLGPVNYQYSVGIASLLMPETFRTSNSTLGLKAVFCNACTWESRHLQRGDGYPKGFLLFEVSLARIMPAMD